MLITLRALKRVNKQNKPSEPEHTFWQISLQSSQSNVVKFDRNGIAMVAFISVRSSLYQ